MSERCRPVRTASGWAVNRRVAGSSPARGAAKKARTDGSLALGSQWLRARSRECAPNARRLRADASVPRPPLNYPIPGGSRHSGSRASARSTRRSARQSATFSRHVHERVGRLRDIGRSAHGHCAGVGIRSVGGRKRGSAMPPSSLRHWFEPDECDVCPPCGERAVVTTDAARHCLACGCIWLQADGAWTLAVSSLHALAPARGTDAAPPPDVERVAQPRPGRSRRRSSRRLAAGTVARSRAEHGPS